MSTNYYNQAIKAQVLIERLKRSQIRDFEKVFLNMIKLLKTKFIDLDEELINLNFRDLNKFVNGLSSEIKEEFQPYVDSYFEDLEKASEVFALSTSKDLSSVVGDIVKIRTLSGAKLSDSYIKRPLSANGKLIKPFFDQMTTSEALRVSDNVRKGFAQGKTNQEIIRTIIGTKSKNFNDGILNISKRNAETLVRTITQHSSSSIRVAIFENNSDIIEKYLYTATLDSRTSAQCRALDGQEFDFGKGPIPPIHFSCRSTTVPIFKDEFSFLEEGQTRSSEDGSISANDNYYDWLKRQDKATQREVLGQSRFDIFNKSGMSADKFRALQLDKNFEPITVQEMRRKIE